MSRDAVAAVAAHPDAVFLGGGTNLVDHMKLGVASPDLLVDVTACRSTASRSCRDGGVRIGAGVAQQRSRRRPADPRALPGARPGAARRRVRAAAQPGDDRRQPAAAHPLRLLPGRHHAVQQARARDRAARRIGGYNRYHAILGASEQCVAVHPSDMAVAMAALDAVVACAARTATRHPARPTSTACPATSPSATPCSSTAS